MNRLLLDIGYYALRLWMFLTIRRLERNHNILDAHLSVTINSYGETIIENAKTELSMKAVGGKE